MPLPCFCRRNLDINICWGALSCLQFFGLWKPSAILSAWPVCGFFSSLLWFHTDLSLFSFFQVDWICWSKLKKADFIFFIIAGKWKSHCSLHKYIFLCKSYLTTQLYLFENLISTEVILKLIVLCQSLVFFLIYDNHSDQQSRPLLSLCLLFNAWFIFSPHAMRSCARFVARERKVYTIYFGT